jgi:hypothetical protein
MVRWDDKGRFIFMFLVDFDFDSRWCAPKFLVRPQKGPTMLKTESSWNLVLLPASSTKGGERGVLKAPGLDWEEGQLI